MSLSKSEIHHVFSIVNTFNLPKHYFGSDFRKEALKQGFPSYILSTEINTILHYISDLYVRSFVTSLWNTGATINEVNCLNRKSFALKMPCPHVKLVNPDYYNSSISYDDELNHIRTIPLISPCYINQIKLLIAKLEMSNFSNHEPTNIYRIWHIDEFTAKSWINEAIMAAGQDGVFFSVDITPDSIRNAFAMNMLTLGVEPSLVMKLMGFKSSKWLKVYLKVNYLIKSLNGHGFFEEF